MSDLLAPLKVVNEPDVVERLGDAKRMRAVLASGLPDSPSEEVFDHATAFAARLIGTAVALMTIVDDTRQFFKAQHGLPEPFATTRETSLSASYCKYVAANGTPFAVTDAANDPIVGDNELTVAGLVGSYLGVPIRNASGDVLGSLCVIEPTAREWTADELRTLQDIVTFLEAELDLRSERDRLLGIHLERENMYALIAHDLRSALTTINGFSTLVSEEKITQARLGITRAAEVIRRNSKQAIDFLDRILDASGGQIDAELAYVDLKAHLDGLLARSLSPERTRVTLNYEGPHVVLTDMLAIRHILINLIDNALKHAGPDAEISVDIQASDDKLVMHIADTGTGIPADVADKLFERFVSGSNSAGHGLGLHIVQQFTEALSGTVEVTRTGEDGTTFTVTIPLEPATR